MPTVQNTDIAKNVVLGSSRVTVSRKPFQSVTGPFAGTDIICLIGHLPGTTSAYKFLPVESLEQILGELALDLADTTATDIVKESDIYTALVSCWAAGGRNVVILGIGNTEDLEEITVDQRYQLIYDRLVLAYKMVVEDEYIQYVVPVEAIAEGHTKSNGTYIDFMQQAAFAMAKGINIGTFTQTFMNTASSDVTILTNAESIRRKEDWQWKDPLQSYCYSPTMGWIPNNDAYRFVAVPAGRGMFALPEYDVAYEGGLAPALAGLSSSLPHDVSSMGRVIRGIRLLNPLSVDDADTLSLAGYMPLGETARQQRARQTGAIVMADNTMAIPASDYQQEVVMRLARRITMVLRLAIAPYIGSGGLGLETEVESRLTWLAGRDVIKGFSYRFARDPGDKHRLLLQVTVMPYLPVKALTIDIVAGPFES